MYELAVKDLERAVELEPTHPNGINYLTTALIHWANEFVLFFLFHPGPYHTSLTRIH